MDCGEAQALIQVTVLSTMLLETVERIDDVTVSDELVADLRELAEWARAQLEGCKRTA